MYLTIACHPVRLFPNTFPPTLLRRGKMLLSDHVQYWWLPADSLLCAASRSLKFSVSVAGLVMLHSLERNNVCGHWFMLNLPVLNCVKMSFAGGEIDCVDKDGNTPLHVAARYGHELLINTLITSGADTAK